MPRHREAKSVENRKAAEAARRGGRDRSGNKEQAGIHKPVGGRGQAERDEAAVRPLHTPRPRG